MAATPQILLMTADSSYLHLLAARQAEATLMRGFTTIRDLTIPDLPAPPGTGRFDPFREGHGKACGGFPKRQSGQVTC